MRKRRGKLLKKVGEIQNSPRAALSQARAKVHFWRA
jgi:hypothetical protein